MLIPILIKLAMVSPTLTFDYKPKSTSFNISHQGLQKIPNFQSFKHSGPQGAVQDM